MIYTYSYSSSLYDVQGHEVSIAEHPSLGQSNNVASNVPENSSTEEGMLVYSAIWATPYYRQRRILKLYFGLWCCFDQAMKDWQIFGYPSMLKIYITRTMWLLLLKVLFQYRNFCVPQTLCCVLLFPLQLS